MSYVRVLKCFLHICFLFILTITISGYSIGEITPLSLEIGIGDSANITCSINLKEFAGQTNRTLYFIEEHTKNRVAESEILRVNESKIVYQIRNATEQNRQYVCMSGKNGIGIAQVIVGTPPLDVKIFRCRSFDYESMICNFTIPENKIPARYNLTFNTASAIKVKKILENGTTVVYDHYYPSQYYVRTCALERYASYALCEMTRDNLKYFPSEEKYNFTLTGNNSLGENKQNFWIPHFDIVVPSRPKLSLHDIGNQTAIFFWSMKMHFYTAKKQLRYEVRLRPDRFDWITLNDGSYKVRREKSHYSLELFNLPYAHYNYTLSLRMRMNSTFQDEDLWSEAGVLRFQTSACLPDASPITDVSSFDLIDAIKPRLRLYWVQRPFYRENGANFQYVITQVRRDGFAVDMKPMHIDRKLAEFPWDKDHHYEFIIKSYNEMGYSIDSSRISVPALGTKHSHDFSPNWIRNVYHEPNRTYTISWNPPNNKNDLVDYTVFWCYSKRLRSNECNGSINFEHLGKYITKYTTAPQKQEQTLNLAVSANYKNFTTGMHWPMCTADITSNLIQMKPQLKAISPYEIEVQWSLECVSTSLLEGYNLTYCPVDDIDATNCAEYSASSVIVDKNAKSFTIQNLQPFTPYKIEMFMFSKLKIGKVSEIAPIRTRESASSPPRELSFSNITSKSVLLSWLPPIDSNGIIRSYIVVENDEMHEISCAEENACGSSENSEIYYKLEPLSSYKNYTVYVLACTVEPSDKSNLINFRTLVGIPSKPQKLTTEPNNETILRWSQPNETMDRVDYFEVCIERWYKNISQGETIYAVIQSTSCILTKPTCVDENESHFIRVRAVTAVLRFKDVDAQLLSESRFNQNELNTKYFSEGNQLKCGNSELSVEQQLKMWHNYQNASAFVYYKSEWETGVIYNCLSHIKQYTLLVSIAGILVGLSIGIIMAKYSFDKFQKMRNIKAHLPPHLLSPPPQSDIYKHNNMNGYKKPYSRGPIHIPTVSIPSKRSGMNGFNQRHNEASSNEDRCLLNSDVVSVMGVSTPVEANYAPMDYLAPPEYTNTSVNTNININGNIDDTYTTMRVIQPIAKENHNMKMDSFDGYVPPGHAAVEAENNLRNMKPYSTADSLPYIPSENCYVKPNQIFKAPQHAPFNAVHAIQLSAMPKINSSGYIETQSCQKPAASLAYGGGYTTLEALNKHENTLSFPQVSATSGYVTHKELSAMGQQKFS